MPLTKARIRILQHAPISTIGPASDPPPARSVRPSLRFVFVLRALRTLLAPPPRDPILTEKMNLVFPCRFCLSPFDYGKILLSFHAPLFPARLAFLFFAGRGDLKLGELYSKDSPPPLSQLVNFLASPLTEFDFFCPSGVFRVESPLKSPAKCGGSHCVPYCFVFLFSQIRPSNRFVLFGPPPLSNWSLPLWTVLRRGCSLTVLRARLRFFSDILFSFRFNFFFLDLHLSTTPPVAPPFPL